MFHYSNKELVLEEFANKFSENDSKETISLFMKTYPEYAKDILEYAGSLLMNKYYSEEPFQNTKEREQFLSQARHAFRQATLPGNEEKFQGIGDKIRKSEIEWTDFQAKTGLNKSVVLNLDQRVVDVTTIPFKVLKSVSEALSVSTLSLRNFLYGGMGPAASANFKSSSAPTGLVKISFEQVIKTDCSLTDEEKERLLT